MGKLIKYLENPVRAYLWATAKGLTRWVPDVLHLRFTYRIRVGTSLDLDNPCTFNEKLQWLKLYDRNPLYNTLVDKVEVKQWVGERIGWEYVVPTFGVWDSIEQVDFDGLPEQFVLKCTHDSGGLAICRDRATFDRDAARRKIGRSLSRNYFWGGREWPYKDVRPRVLAEEYLDAGISGLTDYKFYCFGGNPRLLYVSRGLENHATARISFLNLDWTFAPFSRNDYASFEELPKRPASFDKMVKLARTLSEGIPFVRVDFYDVAGEPKFSEMTFHPCSGFMPFDPPEWDLRLGDMLSLEGAYGPFRSRDVR